MLVLMECIIPDRFSESGLIFQTTRMHKNFTKTAMNTTGMNFSAPAAAQS